MTWEWIDATIQEMAESNDPDIAALGLELEDALEEERITNELVVVQNDEQNDKTVRSSLTEGDMDIHRVHIVKLEKVIE